MPGRLLDLLRSFSPRSGSYRGEVAETFAANLFTAGTQVVTGVMLARYLGAEGRGELGAIQALPIIVATFGMLGLQEAVVYFGASDRRRIGDYAISATALIVLLGIPIYFAAFLITPWYLEGHAPEIVRASQLYGSLLFVYALTTLSIWVARAAHAISSWNRLRVAQSVLWLAVVVTLGFSGAISPTRVALVFLVVMLVGYGVFAILPMRRYLAGGRLRPALWPKMLRYGFPLALGGTPKVLNQRIDQLIIAGMLPAAELGQYLVAVAWAGLMSLVGTAMAGVSFSKIAADTDVASQRRFLGRTLAALAVVSLLGAVALAAAAPFVIPLVFSEEFRGAVPLSVILVLGAFARNLSMLLNESMMGIGRPSAVMFSQWAGLGALVATAAVVVPTAGVTGAAWAVVVGSVVSLVVIAALAWNWARTVAR